MVFDENSATPEELWEHYMEKYKNPNPILKIVTDRFFAVIDRVLGSLPLEFRILEVGCGPGESTRRIQAMLRGQYFEASEFEQRLVDLNLAHGFPVPLTQESAYAMHRADNEFDCVLLLEVLEHLEDFETALQEIFRVARHTVIVSVPNEPLWRILNFARGKYWSEWGNTPGHINHWSSKSIAALVGKYGRVISVQTPTPWTIVHAQVLN